MDVMWFMKKLVFFLAIMGVLLADRTTYGYSWRPQGRFGKRTPQLEAASPIPSQEAEDFRQYLERSPLEDSSSMGGSGSAMVSDPKLAVFRYKDIFCVRQGDEALYRCLRVNKEAMPTE